MKALEWAKSMWADEIAIGAVSVAETKDGSVEVTMHAAASPVQKAILQSLQPALALASKHHGVVYNGTEFREDCIVCTYADITTGV